MAFYIPIEDIDDDVKNFIYSTCKIKKTMNQYDEIPTTYSIFQFDKENERLIVPLSLWKSIYEDFPNEKKKKVKFDVNFELFTSETDPSGRHRDQDVVYKETLKHLYSNHFVFCNLFTGFGKTKMAVRISSKLGKKTIVFCHKDMIKKQWYEEYTTCTNAKVQYVKGNVKIDKSADVYIIGIQKCLKYTSDNFSDIGTVIVDESHLCTLAVYRALFLFSPEYLIGLSATPDRPDGLHKISELFFGKKKNYIVRVEKKNFVVVKYNTNFEPDISYRRYNGKLVLDWNLCINSIAYNEDRQNLIFSVIDKLYTKRIDEIINIHKLEQFTEKNIFNNSVSLKTLILTKRKKECESLYKRILDSNFVKSSKLKCSKLMGSTTKWDENSDILVAILDKCGVGFDWKGLNVLIMCTDIKDVRQASGRLRDRNTLLIDFVDNYKTFQSHWRLREKVYKNKGAIIFEKGKIKTDISERKNNLPSRRFFS